MDEEFAGLISVFAYALSVCTVVVFFYMAANVSLIKRRLTRNKKNYFDLNRLLEIELFKGNNKLACDLLHEKAWMIKSDGDYQPRTRFDKLNEIAEEINKNGGNVSKPLADILQDLSGKLK